MSQAVRIDVEGTVTEVSWEPGRTLEALQVGVEGLVDVVSLQDDTDMWINDEGLYTHDVNLVGTLVADAIRGRHWQNYHGPVVFTGGADEDGETLPLSSAAENRIRAYTEQAVAFTSRHRAGGRVD